MAIDPELEPVIALIPETDVTDAPAVRAVVNDLLASLAPEIPGIETLEIDDLAIPGPPDSPDVQVRVYRPKGLDGPTAAVLYLHGGGFVLGSVDTEHAGAAAIARDLGVVVVSADYRLAPEDPYPAGLEDCYFALVWLADLADQLGVDLDRVAVVGSSAGGGLAAGLALLTRDRQGPKLCFQLLGIPELDDRLDTPSMRAFVDTPMWNRPAAIASWDHYLGEAPAGGERVDVPIYAAPARATVDQLVGLPPTYISTAENDPLRDEGIRYALALLEAGVSVELHQFPGTFHGSAMVTTAAVSRRAGAEFNTVLAKALGVATP